jgi:hypothetical protein
MSCVDELIKNKQHSPTSTILRNMLIKRVGQERMARDIAPVPFFGKIFFRNVPGQDAISKQNFHGVKSNICRAIDLLVRKGREVIVLDSVPFQHYELIHTTRTPFARCHRGRHEGHYYQGGELRHGGGCRRGFSFFCSLFQEMYLNMLFLKLLINRGNILPLASSCFSHCFTSFMLSCRWLKSSPGQAFPKPYH